MMSIRDEALTQTIRRRLASDARTFGQTIEVMIEEDLIVLVGACDTQSQKEAAVHVVTGTYGVRAVRDEVRVRRFAAAT